MNWIRSARILSDNCFMNVFATKTFVLIFIGGFTSFNGRFTLFPDIFSSFPGVLRFINGCLSPSFLYANLKKCFYYFSTEIFLDCLILDTISVFFCYCNSYKLVLNLLFIFFRKAKIWLKGFSLTNSTNYKLKFRRVFITREILLFFLIKVSP